jgi:hypothetical protein
MLRKWVVTTQKQVDPRRLAAHSEEGSKRFEEQQASGKVANRER